MMRSVARWFLVTVLALDVVFAVLLFGGGGLEAIGAEPPKDAATGADAATPSQPAATGDDTWSRAALETLGKRLEARAEQLDRRQAELDELMRGAEVLQRAGLAPAGGRAAGTDETQSTAAAAGADTDDGNDAFTRLQRAYENMEPDSAALALSQLAARDKDAVVELLLGWQPRTSGAILDALTQTDPALAADLSYEIWRRGKSLTAAR